MTSNQHGPYTRGDTRVTMAGTEGSHGVTRSESLKPVVVRTGVCNPTPQKTIFSIRARPSSPVNTFPGLVHTARQAMEAGGA